MTKQFVFGFVLSATVLIGCGTRVAVQSETSAVTLESPRSDEDTAAEAIDRMLEVASNGDWQAYVNNYYGEQHKFRSDTDHDLLVRRFEEKWGTQVVQGLTRAAELPVHIAGDQAQFRDGDDTVFVLHRDEAGGWKFHL